ncbi:MAG: hypothetical protein KAW00_01465 [Dehalococcoidia bacterium]|nr:hypothetical protein [Dehalococcoidia bacterium]
MTEQLGKIEKPLAEQFKGSKKLYLVPLMFSGEDAPAEYKERCQHYWEQVAEQLANLEEKIGRVNRVYHESISLSGEDGMKVAEKINQSCYQIAKSKCDNEATFEAIEDGELLEEVIDWERCLLLGFATVKVASKVSEFYTETSRKRYEFMANRITETLKDNEAGLLFIREGHRLQFPKDIEVFSISPPALDEIHRWIRDEASKKEEIKEEEGKVEEPRETGEKK